MQMTESMVRWALPVCYWIDIFRYKELSHHNPIHVCVVKQAQQMARARIGCLFTTEGQQNMQTTASMIHRALPLHYQIGISQ